MFALYTLVCRKSNLHLLRWNRVVLDYSPDVNISLGSLRGNALRTLNAGSKIAVVTDADGCSSENHVEDDADEFPSARQLQSIREVLGVSSAVCADDSIFRLV